MNQALTLPGIGDLVDGRFRIDRKLGEGGTSTVYEVSHVITDKKFAIKWLLPELALEDAAVDRFIHEARVGGKFAHRHAVQVYDICKASDSFYMLMELLQGESLQSRLERVGSLSVQDACTIVLTCADVLCAAHRVGIIHRDLKPANIFLSKEDDNPEVTKLLDFGISTFYSDLQNISLTATPTGSVIGTPLYMSPEQMLGEPVDPRADIYALGAVLYELVSGQPPFHADSYGELVVKVTVEARPTPLQEIAPVDRQFAAVVARAMARWPNDRFSTVEELIFALRPYAAPLDTSTVRTISAAAKPEPTLSPAHQSARGAGEMRRRGMWTGALGLAAATVATVGALWIEHANDTVSAATLTPAVQPEHRRSVVLDDTMFPGDWDRAVGEEVLTGRAAPDSLPLTAATAATAARAAATPATISKGARRAPKQAGALHQDEVLAPKSNLEREPEPDANKAAPAEDEAAATPKESPISDPPAAAQSARPKAPRPNVQIRRGDFRAPPGLPNAPPPKASVSRTDF